MRKRFNVQLELGAVPIEQIEIPRSRDEEPPVIAALQWLFCHQEASEEVFELLEKHITPAQKKSGRKGMDLWTILVLGVLRLTLNCNYDRLHHHANYDSLCRQLLGQRAFDQSLKIGLSTIKENVSLLSEELLLEVSGVIAKHGHGLIQKKTKKFILK